MKTSLDNFESTCGDYTQVSNCINYFCHLAGKMAINELAAAAIHTVVAAGILVGEETVPMR